MQSKGECAIRPLIRCVPATSAASEFTHPVPCSVLPKGAKERLVSELEKRLDLDIDKILDSPKLRLQLSPAELDQRLLYLYNNVTEGPTGDVLRVIGGGQEVALQDFYIKSRAARKAAKDPQALEKLNFGPFQALGDESDEDRRTASQWVNQVLRRNLPKDEVPLPSRKGKRRDKSNMSMSLSTGPAFQKAPGSWSQSCLRTTTFVRPASIGRSVQSKFSLLI